MNKEKLVLPKQDEQGNYYLSYSAIKSWNEAKGFNTGLLGKYEFILNYFLGQTWEDKNGFAQFGTEVEDVICGKEGSEAKFTKGELILLKCIKPLGLFQQEIKIPFDGFYIKGFIDDCTPDYTKIRDYKTASLNSSKKYYDDDYDQLDVYAMGVKAITGELPKALEVVCIERLGNGFRGGRNVMSVGNEVWYIPRTTSKERQEKLKEKITKTAQEISEYYKVFLKLNKN